MQGIQLLHDFISGCGGEGQNYALGSRRVVFSETHIRILNTTNLQCCLRVNYLNCSLAYPYIVLQGWHSSGVWRSFQSSDSSHTACSGLGSGACPQYGETQRVCLKQKKKKKPRQINSIGHTTTTKSTPQVNQPAPQPPTPTSQTHPRPHQITPPDHRNPPTWERNKVRVRSSRSN